MSESEAVYRTHLLKLQFEELIKENYVGTSKYAKEQRNQQLYSGLVKVEQYVRDLKDALEHLPKTKVSVKAGQIVAGLQIHQQNTMSVSVAHPTRLDMAGSYLLGAAARPNLNVDVVLQMPEEMFEEKDYAQYRYFDKRATYLAAVASHLSQYGDLRYADITVTNFRGDPLKPVVLLHPVQAVEPVPAKGSVQLQRAKGLLGKFVIRLFAVPPPVFPLRKLGPARNNLKEIEVQTAEGVRLVPNAAPTPLYNQLVLEDLCMLSHFYSAAAAIAEFPLLSHAVTVLKTWAALRGLTSTGVGCALDVDGSKRPVRAPVAAALGGKKDALGGRAVFEYSAPEDGCSGFFLTQVVAYLFATGRIHATNDLYQCVFAALFFLATHDLAAAPIAFPADPDADLPPADRPSEATFAAAFDAVFLDAGGLVNLAARMAASRLAELRHHALLAVNTLAGRGSLNTGAGAKLDVSAIKSVHLAGANLLSEEEAFAYLFLEPVRADTLYDQVVTVTLPPAARLYHPALAAAGVKGNASAGPLPLLTRAQPAVVSEAAAPLLPKLPALDAYSAMMRRAAPLLHRALTDRAYLVTVTPAPATAAACCAPRTHSAPWTRAPRPTTRPTRPSSAPSGATSRSSAASRTAPSSRRSSGTSAPATSTRSPAPSSPTPSASTSSPPPPRTSSSTRPSTRSRPSSTAGPPTTRPPPRAAPRSRRRRCPCLR
jgi:hypothetical protein